MRAYNLIHIPVPGGFQANFNSLFRVGRGVIANVPIWLQRMQQRRELRSLLDNDERFFSDIGVSRAAVFSESVKWFWQD